MRPLPFALAVACMLAAAGCLESPPAPPESSLAEGPEPAPRAIAFHRWSACLDCDDGRRGPELLFVALEDGTALLARLVAPEAPRSVDPAWRDVLGTLDATSEALDDLAVERVENETMDPDAFARLNASLESDWNGGAPARDAPCVERICPSLLGRASPDGAWETMRVESPPDPADPAGERVLRLLMAFAAAEASVGLPPILAERPKETPPEERPGPSWQGQDNEFGSIRAPYSVRVVVDERAPVVAEVVLRDHYEAKDARFFLFQWSVENTPLNLTFDGLTRADTGDELPCVRREGDANSSIKCFVDLKDMPPAGTGIQLSGTVATARVGLYQVGAIVTPFTHTWTRVEMSNGLAAELYAGTQVAAEARPQAS